jgi:hypothetical protein
MSQNKHTDDIQAAATDLAACLAQRNQNASIHLARLILADRAHEGSTYRLFARALTHQLRQWAGRLQTVQEDDVTQILKGAARELISEDWDE